MEDGLDADVAETGEAATDRDEVVAAVTDHAGRIARELARLRGGDEGERRFDTDAGTWTLSYAGGDVESLRFDGGRGETDVVSTGRPPDPADLAAAMEHYDAFVAAYTDHVRSREGVLDGVTAEFPAVESVDGVVAERERILGRVRETADAMARELRRAEGGEYGTFAERVEGSRWELKWEDGRASYLRVGGEGGVYLLSQYQPPAVRDLRAHADDFAGFVDAFNDHVAELSADLSTVSL